MKNTISRIFKPVAYTLLVSGVLFSTSCSSSSIDEPQIEQATSHKQQTVSIPIQAEVQLDESARSLIYKVGQDGSFKYNLKDGTLKLFTTIRNSQPGKAQYSAILDWKVDAQSNTLYLNQAVSISPELEQAMEQGTWYASVAFSPTLGSNHNYSGEGPTITSQRFGYGHGAKPQDGGIYEGLSPNVFHYTPGTDLKPRIYVDHMDYYGPKAGLDQVGPAITESEREHIPTVYIMPWTKVDITGKKYVAPILDYSPRNISYRETTEEGKRIKFSGTLKPIGSVVRIKLEAEPATFEMKDGSKNTEDIKEYVEDAVWKIEKFHIRSQHHQGYYDFASGVVNAGQLPPRVSTNSAETEILALGPDNSTRFFNAPKEELGYFYYWTPDNTSFTVEYDLNHPYKESSALLADTPFEYVGPTRLGGGRASYNTTYKAHLPARSQVLSSEEATQKVLRLINRNPYYFTCRHIYEPNTVNATAGHTKVITIKIKPEVREAQRYPSQYKPATGGHI